MEMHFCRCSNWIFKISGNNENHETKVLMCASYQIFFNDTELNTADRQTDLASGETVSPPSGTR